MLYLRWPAFDYIRHAGVDIDWRNQNMFVLKTGEAKYYVGKYRGVNRIPLLKLSEMYLIAAEASGDKSWLRLYAITGDM